jgi:diacylglycerol kinase (ATP)
MKKQEANFFIRVIRSFTFAFRGIGFFFLNPSNAWVHVLASIVVVIFGFWLNISASEWMALTLAVVLVLAAEMFNSALETLTDLVSPEFHELAGKAKDLAAGAVLLTAIGAFVVGLLVFAPKLF